jgi:hypothetical protein
MKASYAWCVHSQHLRESTHLKERALNAKKKHSLQPKVQQSAGSLHYRHTIVAPNRTVAHAGLCSHRVVLLDAASRSTCCHDAMHTNICHGLGI